MNPTRVDFVADLAYGIMIFFAVVLLLVVGTEVGVAFGIGVLLSYLIHVGWKMARFDPDWMTREVVQTVEETLSKEVDEVIEKIEDVNERVDRRPRAEEIDAKIEHQTEVLEAKLDDQTDGGKGVDADEGERVDVDESGRVDADDSDYGDSASLDGSDRSGSNPTQ